MLYYCDGTAIGRATCGCDTSSLVVDVITARMSCWMIITVVRGCLTQLQYGVDVTWNLQRARSTSVNVPWSVNVQCCSTRMIIISCVMWTLICRWTTRIAIYTIFYLSHVTCFILYLIHIIINNTQAKHHHGPSSRQRSSPYVSNPSSVGLPPRRTL